MCFWLGFTVALTTQYVASQGNLVTINGPLVMTVPSIPWVLLIGSWVEFVKLGRKGW